MTLFENFILIQKQMQQIEIQNYEDTIHTQECEKNKKYELLFDRQCLNEEYRKRLWNEFFGYGPIDNLLDDSEIKEILVLGPDRIFVERSRGLKQIDDRFFSETTFYGFIERLQQEASTNITLEHPIADGRFRNFRINLVGASITKNYPNVSLRAHPKQSWTLERLEAAEWFSPQQRRVIERILRDEDNFLVVGPTGCGKTSFLSACLQSLPYENRIVIIEDTDEIHLPNSVSTKMLTRFDHNKILPEINQSDLVKQSLRMRPDRIVMGEIRGAEAKDLLLALATGHKGSAGSLHAMSAQQALKRLEMLVQMGAPFWSLHTIRSLIYLSVKYILVSGFNSQHQRCLLGIYEISSLEETGFLTGAVEA